MRSSQQAHPLASLLSKASLFALSGPYRLDFNFVITIAVTIGAGVQWGTIYALADDHNRSIAGGFSVEGSVGAAAGWVLGAGHSVLSPFYGLGTVESITNKLPILNGSSRSR